MKNRRIPLPGMDPRINPAVLDTVSWDVEKIKKRISKTDNSFWINVADVMLQGGKFPERPDIELFSDSLVSAGNGTYLMARFEDGQHVFIGTASPFMEPLHHLEKTEGRLYFYPVNTASVLNYFNVVDCSKRPEALGPVPRLGIGNRMSTNQWPAIFSAMKNGEFSANAIQNSIRELCTLDEILNVRECETNYLYGFGDITSGHTGNTFEGLWLYGVLEALKQRKGPGYGADADHLKIKPGASGLTGVKKLIEIARNYTFFTIDLSPVLNYKALADTRSSFPVQETKAIGDMQLFHKEILSSYGIDAILLDKVISKYSVALDALEEVDQYIKQLKGRDVYDLELSIDEIPEGFNVFTQLTRPYELQFLINECERRGITLTHIAPNFGVEKGVDYRGLGGYPVLEKRIKELNEVVRDSGMILDCHSGDDLSSDTRMIFKKATDGNLHFKISPKPQEIFAECLFDMYPDIFRKWWDITLEHVTIQAEKGSEAAIRDLREFLVEGDEKISPYEKLFLHYGYAAVGKRNNKGFFEIREQFYSLPTAFADEYSLRLEKYLHALSIDLFVK